MNKPLGGKLVDRIADAQTKRKLLSRRAPKIVVPLERQLEAWSIATGAYSPLTGFLGKRDMAAVMRSCMLSSGVFWPVPVVLDIDAAERRLLRESGEAFLADASGKIFAHLAVDEIYRFPMRAFESHIFGTHDRKHPGVAHIRSAKEYLVGGSITWIGEALERTSPSYTPAQSRALFKKKGWRRIVAFHTRNVPHRGHEHVQLAGLAHAEGLFVQPLIGRKKRGDFHNDVVAKAYRYFVSHVLPRGKAILSFLPYSAYFAGPREALLTAVIRKNFGCTHFIVGRDHTGVGDFYTRAQYARLFKKYGAAMGIQILHFGAAFYCTRCQATAFDETCPHEERYRVHPSGTAIRRALTTGKRPPHEMIRPELASILRAYKGALFVR